MKSLLKKVMDVLSYLIIIFMILIIGWSFLGKGHPPSILGYKFLTVLSGSMEPTINTGSLIIINDKVSDLDVGDIITYNVSGSTNVTHRIAEILDEDGEKAFITRGDANNANDVVPVKEAIVEGKVIFSMPYIGKIIYFLRGKLIFIIVPLMIFLLFKKEKIKKFK